MGTELTGRKVLAICVCAFGVVIAVNVLLAVDAVRTFPGLEVKSSYIASQTFDADRKAQQALGWSLEPGYADGVLTLAFRDGHGGAVRPKSVEVLVGRTTEAADDRTPRLAWVNGHYQASTVLEPGRWMLQVQAVADNGTAFKQRRSLVVKGPRS